MQYLYEPAASDYEDFASGRVLYHAPGATGFPVRLAGEIIQRCFARLEARCHGGPYAVYDPCCGGGYLLAVAALLHGHRLNRIYASDIDPDLVKVAERNLSLLTPEGMRQRQEQLRQLFDAYGKPSHRDALDSSERLAERIERLRLEETVCFRRDITAPDGDRIPKRVHIVLTDLPYGQLARWEGESAAPLDRFFENVAESLEPGRSVVTVVADKHQKLKHDRFRRVQHFKIGKRQVALFELIDRP
jgi:23S rRNA G2445 N2-methylase RlmL